MSGTTIGAAIAAATARLAARGIEGPRRDARLLVGLAAGLADAAILGYPERTLDGAAADRLACLLTRRLAGEPFSRLAGRREFWSLDLALSPDTLDPRPDSETVVEAALEQVQSRSAPLRILDLGTGTGCLLLALLTVLPGAWGVGIDVVPGAAELARRNAASMSLESRAFFAVGRWVDPILGRFDLVVSNPPYVASGAIAGLAPEVALHDPKTALDGGADGLAAYRAMAPTLEAVLAPGGSAVIEFGDGQGDDVASIFICAGLDVVRRRCDIAGRERCMVLGHSKKTVGMRGLPV